MLEILVDEEFDLEGSPILGDETDDVWLDVEARPVYDAPDGWPYRRRHQPFMVALCGAMDPGVFWIQVIAGDEPDIIDYLATNLEGRTLRYASHKGAFDEMVLRGRFTTWRRPPAAEPGPWANLDGEASISWLNVWPAIRRATGLLSRDASPDDLPSKDVPAAWARGEKDLVARHCLRDALGLALSDPEAVFSQKLRGRLMKLM